MDLQFLEISTEEFLAGFSPGRDMSPAQLQRVGELSRLADARDTADATGIVVRYMDWLFAKTR